MDVEWFDPSNRAWVVIICLLIVLLSGLIIYVISAITMREKPFEEIIAEQQRKQRELMEKTSKDSATKKVDKKKKFKKGKGTGGGTGIAVEKDSPSSDEHSVDLLESSDLDNEKRPTKGGGGKRKSDPPATPPPKMVQLEIEPDVIDIPADTDGTNVQKGLKKRKPQVLEGSGQTKSILHNRDEKSIVKPTLEATELFHRKSVPKDDVELKRAHNEAAGGMAGHRITAEGKMPTEDVSSTLMNEHNGTEHRKSDKKEKDGEKKKKSKELVGRGEVVENVEQISAVNVTTFAPPSSSQSSGDQPGKTKKNRTLDAAKLSTMTADDGDDLLATVQMARLSDSEIRNLVELLIGKLSSAEAAKTIPNIDWTKSGRQKDTVSALRKELEEKEQWLSDERKRNQAGNTKIQELAAERQRIVKQSQEQLSSQMVETQALKGQLQRTHEEMKLQRGKLESALSDNSIQLQRLVEENKVLKEAAAKAVRVTAVEAATEELRQKVKVMEDALKQNAVNYNSVDNIKKNLEVKVKQYEEQINRMEGSVREASVMGQRYNDMAEELRKAEVRLNSLSTELRNADQNKNSKTEELRTAENKLRDSEKSYAVIASQLEELKASCHKKDSDIQAMSMQIQQLSSESKAANEKLQQKSASTHESSLAQQEDEIKEMQIQHEEAVKQIRVRYEETLAVITSELKQSKAEKQEAERQLRADLEERQEKILQLETANERLLLSLEQNQNATESETVNNQNVSRLVIELNEVTTRLDKKHAELESLRQENQVLSDSVRRCEEQKAQLLLHRANESENDTQNSVNGNGNSDLGMETEWIKKETVLKQQLIDAENRLSALEVSHHDERWQLIQKHSMREIELRKDYESKLADISQKLTDSSGISANLGGSQKELQELHSLANLKLAEDEQHLRALHEKMSVTERQLDELRKKIAGYGEKDRELVEMRGRLEFAEHELVLLTSELEASRNAELHWGNERARFTELCKQECAMLASEARGREIEMVLSEMENRLREFMIRDGEFTQKEKSWHQSLTDAEQHVINLKQIVCEGEKARVKQSEAYNIQLNEYRCRVLDLEARETDLLSRLKDAGEKWEKLCAGGALVTEQLHDLKAAASLHTNSNVPCTIHSDTNFSDVSQPSAIDSQAVISHKEVTVFTHAHETSQWDMSQVVKDLDTKEAEIQILHAVLSQKENAIRLIEDEKLKLAASLKASQASQSAIAAELESAQLTQLQLAAELESSRSQQLQQPDNQINEQELSEAREAQNKLQLQVDHYKTVLSQTESMLNQLQSKVEEEDDKWQQRLKSSEEQLQQAREEINRLQGDMKSLTGSTELNDKTRMLEDRLEAVESEKLDALLQLSQLRASFENVSTELSNLRRATSENENVVANGSDLPSTDISPAKSSPTPVADV